MSIPKAAGIETEYGIMVWGVDDFSPFQASQLVLDAYQHIGAGPSIPMGLYYNVQTGDITEEQATQNGSAVHYGLGSLMLANGARYYIDHAHPEYCTPETLSPRGVVCADKAGERILAACTGIVNDQGILPDGQRMLIYKNNSDQKGNSYGCHENYLLSVDLFEDLLRRRSHIIYRYLLPFLVSRILITGAGKVGYENHRQPATFQLSQRADFFETLTGLQTTYQRPLFNLRDEAHVNRHMYRRLHVILGDANMAELSTYLKIGITQLVLHMIEDGFIQTDLTLANPVEAFQHISRDLTFNQPVRLENGRNLTAIELQTNYLEHAERYLTTYGGTDEQWDIWERWADTLDHVRAGNWSALATSLDWAIKRHVLERYLTGQHTDWAAVEAWQHVIELALMIGGLTDAQQLAESIGLDWGDYEQQRAIYFTLRRLDLEYHDIRHQGDHAGLFYRLQQGGHIDRLLVEDEVVSAVHHPPTDTRAWLRGKIVDRFARQIIGADWSYIKLVYSTPSSSQVFQLEFPDPLRGTAYDLSPAWNQLRTPEQLFRYFQGNTQAISPQNT